MGQEAGLQVHLKLQVLLLTGRLENRSCKSKNSNTSRLSQTPGPKQNVLEFNLLIPATSQNFCICQRKMESRLEKFLSLDSVSHGYVKLTQTKYKQKIQTHTFYQHITWFQPSYSSPQSSGIFPFLLFFFLKQQTNSQNLSQYVLQYICKYNCQQSPVSLLLLIYYVFFLNYFLPFFVLFISLSSKSQLNFHHCNFTKFLHY